MEVFLLCHVRHARNIDGTPPTHRSVEGELVWDEEDGDDLKILGAYSTDERAQDRITGARQLPGFRDEPDCFHVDRYNLDEDHWQDGFVTIPRTETPEADSGGGA